MTTVVFKTLCQRDPATGLCTQCEEPVAERDHPSCLAKRRNTATATAKAAGEIVIKPKGVGDVAAEFFASLGVTEERYKATKKALHLDPNCNCQGRRENLNKLGEALGVDKAASKLSAWWRERRDK